MHQHGAVHGHRSQQQLCNSSAKIAQRTTDWNLDVSSSPTTTWRRMARSDSSSVLIRGAFSYSPPMDITLKSSCIRTDPTSKSTTVWKAHQRKTLRRCTEPLLHLAPGPWMRSSTTPSVRRGRHVSQPGGNGFKSAPVTLAGDQLRDCSPNPASGGRSELVWERGRNSRQ